MDALANPVVLLLMGGAGSMLLNWAKGQIEAFTSRADRFEDREERRDDKASNQGEAMAAALARIAQLETDRTKIIDVMDRLARLEEFRIHASPKLDEADRTSRAIVGVNEQIKTIFNRLDALPGEVVDLLKLHIRGAPARA